MTRICIKLALASFSHTPQKGRDPGRPGKPPRGPPKVTFVGAAKSNGKTLHFKPGLDHFVSGGVPAYFSRLPTSSE